MTVSVRFTFNEQTFRQMQATGGTFDTAVRRGAGMVRDTAKRNITSDGTVDTGRLRQSIESVPVQGRSGIWYEVGSRLFYARWIHDGTRDHGPVRARMLRFKPK